METLGHAYAYMRMCMHAQALRAHASYTRTHTRACMHMLGSRNYERKVFFAFKTWFWNESHIIWEPFQNPIFLL